MFPISVRVWRVSSWPYVVARVPIIGSHELAAKDCASLLPLFLSPSPKERKAEAVEQASVVLPRLSALHANPKAPKCRFVALGSGAKELSTNQGSSKTTPLSV